MFRFLDYTPYKVFLDLGGGNFSIVVPHPGPERMVVAAQTSMFFKIEVFFLETDFESEDLDTQLVGNQGTKVNPWRGVASYH